MKAPSPVALAAACLVIMVVSGFLAVCCAMRDNWPATAGFTVVQVLSMAGLLLSESKR